MKLKMVKSRGKDLFATDVEEGFSWLITGIDIHVVTADLQYSNLITNNVS